MASSRYKLYALLTVVMLYGYLYLNWYWSTPLGLAPVLDGSENIALAEKIYTGTLPVEPFYRAMLYPLLLAGFRFLGISADSMMFVAGNLGMIFHLLTTLLIFNIAAAVWKKKTTGLLAAALYGFYPLAIYFAAEPLDITAAIFFLTLGIYLYLKKFDEASASSGLSSGLAIGIGGLFRANVLAAAGLFFIDIFVKNHRRKAFLALISVSMTTLAGGLAGWWHSGEFRLMPWQGAFTLYIANSATANGKYFSHTVILPDRDLGYNPARLESEILYARETGIKDKHSIDDFNQFWVNKTLNHIKNNPWQWLSLKLRKLYYLANNFEQYNNKTYAFHRDLSPILRHNPLCWGILLIAAVIALINTDCLTPELKRLLLILLMMAAGTMIFLVSARFRFLLVPPLVVIASGLLQQQPFKQRKKYKNLTAGAIVAMITFSTFFAAADMSTINSDRMLLAHACARIFDYNGQVYWANQVLKEIPDHVQAIRLKVAGFTNLILGGNREIPWDWSFIEKELAWLARHDLQFPDTAFLSGCYAFSVLGDRKKAGEIWQKGQNLYPDKNLYLAALVHTGFEKLPPSTNALPGTLLWGIKISQGLLPNDNARFFEHVQRITRFFFSAPVTE